jgi:hypothetical protein
MCRHSTRFQILRRATIALRDAVYCCHIHRPRRRCDMPLCCCRRHSFTPVLLPPPSARRRRTPAALIARHATDSRPNRTRRSARQPPSAAVIGVSLQRATRRCRCVRGEVSARNAKICVRKRGGRCDVTAQAACCERREKRRPVVRRQRQRWRAQRARRWRVRLSINARRHEVYAYSGHYALPHDTLHLLRPLRVVCLIG